MNKSHKMPCVVFISHLSKHYGCHVYVFLLQVIGSKYLHIHMSGYVFVLFMPYVILCFGPLCRCIDWIFNLLWHQYVRGFIALSASGFDAGIYFT